MEPVFLKNKLENEVCLDMSYFWYSDMELQHLAQWKEYSKFSNDEKKSYLQDPIPHSKRQFKLVFKEHRFHAMHLWTKNCRRYSWGNAFSSCGQGRSTKHFSGNNALCYKFITKILYNLD